MKHVTIAGLEQRRQARIAERHRAKTEKLRALKVPRGEKREIRMMQLFFSSLPHDDLRAAYTAVKAALEKRKKNTP